MGSTTEDMLPCCPCTDVTFQTRYISCYSYCIHDTFWFGDTVFLIKTPDVLPVF